MLVIRLSRTGRNKIPTFRVVVAEKARSAKGKYQEILGDYRPAQEKPVLNFDKERILYWISRGAQPSETVARLLARNGMQEMSAYFDPNRKFNTRNKKAPKEQPAPAAPAAPAGESAPVAEAPQQAEETPS